VTIEPAELYIPGGFFSREQSLLTEPVSLSVRPLPDPAPLGYDGAVGEFAIESTIDSGAVTLNDTVAWRVAVRGKGNIDSLPDPRWQEGPEWRAFDSDPQVTTEFQDGYRQGSRVYERVMVPTQPGTLTLLAIEYVYFNPATGSYATATSTPLQVNVAPAAAGSAPVQQLAAPAAGAAGALPAENPAVAGGTLRPIKESSLYAGARSLVARPLFWLLWLVPVALVGGLAVLSGYQRRRDAGVVERRSKNAAGIAHRAIQRAKDDPAQAGPILMAYLESRLNKPMAGLTHEAVGAILREAGASDDLSESALDVLSRSDALRFAPAHDEDGRQLLADANDLIAALDKALV
jgi:hypothetical protein